MLTLLRHQFNLSLASLPTLQLFAAPSPDVLALVKSILEEFYTDGIDQIVSAQLNDADNIVGQFIDQVGARQVKRYQYQITDEDVAFKLLNPNEVQNFAFEKFATAQKCKTGTPCKGRCISPLKVCKPIHSPESAAKTKQAKAQLGAKTTSKPPSPTPSSGKPEPKSTLNQSEILQGPKVEKRIAKELSSWQDIAAKKAKKDPVFRDNFGMVLDLALEHQSDAKNSRLLVSGGKAQAAASVRVSKSDYHVEYLATAPFNADPKDKRYSKGHGTKMMQSLMQEAIANKTPMTLESLPKAVGFYKKLGFKSKGQAKGFNEGVESMSITVKEMQKFLRARGISQFALSEALEDLEIKAFGAFCVGIGSHSQGSEAPPSQNPLEA